MRGIRLAYFVRGDVSREKGMEGGMGVWKAEDPFSTLEKRISRMWWGT